MVRFMLFLEAGVCGKFFATQRACSNVFVRLGLSRLLLVLLLVVLLHLAVLLLVLLLLLLLRKYWLMLLTILSLLHLELRPLSPMLFWARHDLWYLPFRGEQ